MTTEQNYLEATLGIIIRAAKEAKSSSDVGKEQRSPEQQAFEEGRALAYYEVLSTLINQAEIFGLSCDTLPALNFDADAELLGIG